MFEAVPYGGGSASCGRSPWTVGSLVLWTACSEVSARLVHLVGDAASVRICIVPFRTCGKRGHDEGSATRLSSAQAGRVVSGRQVARCDDLAGLQRCAWCAHAKPDVLERYSCKRDACLGELLWLCWSWWSWVFSAALCAVVAHVVASWSFSKWRNRVSVSALAGLSVKWFCCRRLARHPGQIVALCSFPDVLPDPFLV